MAESLEQALNDLTTGTYAESYILVNSDRTISVPPELTNIAVKEDDRAVTVSFNCPRVWDNADLGTLNIDILAVSPAKLFFRIPAKNKQVTEEYVHFDWDISRGLTAVVGPIVFALEAYDGVTVKASNIVWHSDICKMMQVSEGLYSTAVQYATPGTPIEIGKTGENAAMTVLFNEPISWKTIYGPGTTHLLYQRPGEKTAYPAMLTTVTSGAAIWNVNSTHTAIVGKGQAELRYIVNDVVVKSVIYDVNVIASLADDGEEPIPPDQSFLDQLIAEADRAVQAATDSEASATLAGQHADKAGLDSEEATKQAGLSKESADAAALSAQNAKTSETNAKTSETNASTSESTASQALADLLKMIGTDIATLVGGKIPMDQIPATATQEIYEITSEDQLVTLVAQKGDLAELITEVDGERTITKTWQCLGDATVRDNWVVWGTAYAVQAGNATVADTANNANMINNHRMVEMKREAFDTAVKDPTTYYLVYDEASEV